MGEKLGAAEQAGIEADLAGADAQAPFSQAGDHFLFHAAGHSRLRRAACERSVGIWIGGKGAVFGGGFPEPEPGADVVVALRQGLDVMRRIAGVDAAPETFLGGQHQLGNHVPVNAADAFIGIHALGASVEVFVSEYIVKKLQDTGCLRGDEMFPALIGFEARQRLLNVGAVSEMPVEAMDAIGVTRDDGAVAAFDQDDQKRIGQHGVG